MIREPLPLQSGPPPAARAVDRLAAARTLLRKGIGEAVLTVGSESPRLAGYHVSRRHIVVTVGAPGWRWPTGQADDVGELLIRDRLRRLEISLLGWWSPVGVAELVGMPQALMAMSPDWRFVDPWAMVESAPVLRLDSATATVWDGRHRVSLEHEQLQRELLP